MTPLLVALAGGLGVLARYTVGLATTSIRSTLAVNVLGSLLLGALTHLGRDLPSAALQALGVGLLGGFTTFSTFSVQALLTADDGRPMTAALYVVASVALGVSAAAVGYMASRALAPLRTPHAGAGTTGTLFRQRPQGAEGPALSARDRCTERKRAPGTGFRRPVCDRGAGGSGAAAPGAEGVDPSPARPPAGRSHK